MWDLIVSVPDHCLSFYFASMLMRKTKIKIMYCSVTSDPFLCFINVHVQLIPDQLI